MATTFLHNKSILITGGTGSFGSKFVERILTEYSDIKKLVIFSRDELKQFELAQKFPPSHYPQIRYFLGDIRDAARFKRACEGIDIIIHAAALKQVPAAEYNPMEFIKTNIIGAENIINAVLDTDVQHVVALSTDKAAAPINLYGATKLCSDKLFIAANNIKGFRNVKFSVVRYGNVIGSRGSVIPFFLQHRDKGYLPITHPDMTRFNITLSEGIDLVLYALQHAWGGEVFVPKIPSYKITDVAQAIAPHAEQRIVGIRAGEKLHEDMITQSDALNTIALKNLFVITPNNSSFDMEAFKKQFNGVNVPPDFSYNSGKNDDWLSVEQIREQIRLNIDKNFSV